MRCERFTSKIRHEGEIILFYAEVDPKISQGNDTKDSKPRKDIQYHVVKMKNNIKDSEFKFKSLVFWCQDENERESVRKSKFMIAGDYLFRCTKHEEKWYVFANELKLDDQGLLATGSLSEVFI